MMNTTEILEQLNCIFRKVLKNDSLVLTAVR